jgi:kynurenine formamidase
MAGRLSNRRESSALWEILCGLIGVLTLWATAGCRAGVPSPGHPAQVQSRIVDLTHAFGADTIVWPTEQDFVLIPQHAEQMPGGYFYTSNRLAMPEHGGTHIDAPVHFARGAQTLDQIPLERLIGPGVRIDLSAKCSKDRDYRVGVHDLEQWETEHGIIAEGMIVLLDTGFGEFWLSRKDYLGTELRGAEGVSALHFPGLHPEAAAWLVRERRIKAIGIDTASIDYGPSTKFETHVELLSHDVPVFENLASVSRLPERGFEIIALPMKIAGGSGGPLRIIAVIPAASRPTHD